jgi:hypothetical protein
MPHRVSAPDGNSSELNGLAQAQVLPSVQLPHTPERPLAGLPREHAAAAQDAAGSSYSSGRSSVSNTAAVADSANISVTVQDAAAATPFAKASTADGGHTEEGSLMQLVSPAELPPGEFTCITRAMLLQVSVCHAARLACRYCITDSCTSVQFT